MQQLNGELTNKHKEQDAKHEKMQKNSQLNQALQGIREASFKTKNTECRAWICCDALVLLDQGLRESRNFLFGTMFGV